MYISLVFPACNQGRYLYETLDHISFGLDKWRPVEVIVVDDHSTDGSTDKLPAGTICVKPPYRLGVSGARAYGAAKATGDVIIIVDPHMWFGRGSIVQVANAAIAHHGIVQPVVLVQTKGLAYGGRLRCRGTGLEVRKCVTCPVSHPMMIGGYFAMSRQVYEKLNGLPCMPGYWTYYELALSTMLYRLGMSMAVVPGPCSIHRKYRSTGRTPFDVQLRDRWMNAHWAHSVMFPENYSRWFVRLLPVLTSYDRSTVVETSGPWQEWLKEKSMVSETDTLNMLYGGDFSTHRIIRQVEQ